MSVRRASCLPMAVPSIRGASYLIASKRDCTVCKLKPRCTTSVARKVSRDIDEDIGEQVRALANMACGLPMGPPLAQHRPHRSGRDDVH